MLITRINNFESILEPPIFGFIPTCDFELILETHLISFVLVLLRVSLRQILV